MRSTDLDVLGHVNNAIAWAAVEDEVARTDAFGGARIGAAEMEYRAALDGDERCELVSAPIDGGLACWLVSDGDTRAAVRIFEPS